MIEIGEYQKREETWGITLCHVKGKISLLFSVASELQEIVIGFTTTQLN